uniref:Uncharacterized protein n=1 Tax=Anopheles melas TaxID=34690 RepID=A0A182U383_9DIPT
MSSYTMYAIAVLLGWLATTIGALDDGEFDESSSTDTSVAVSGRGHHEDFNEYVWPLHWVSAAYVWGFLKLGAIFAGLMLLFVFRHLSWWNSTPAYLGHDAPV